MSMQTYARKRGRATNLGVAVIIGGTSMRHIGKRTAGIVTSKRHWPARIGIGACVTSLTAAALLATPAAMAEDKRKLVDETATWGTPHEEHAAGVTPADAVAGTNAAVDQEAAQLGTSVDVETARLATFVEQAKVARNKSMETAGVEAKARLTADIAQLLKKAERAIPKDGRLKPAWQPGSANQCRQVDGTDLIKKGTAVCSTNNDQDQRATARAQGDGATAAAYAIHDGGARARAQGDNSIATAKSGDAIRTGQSDNVSDAVSTGGSTVTATAGLGDDDEHNKARAVADDGSLAVADASFGDKNDMFAGAVNKGEARVSNRAGDGNIGIALGANGSNDGNGPAGARVTIAIGFDNTAVSLADGVNSAATTNGGYGDRHKAVALSGPNSHARGDSVQGDESASFADATDRGHALAFNSYGDYMLAIAKSKGDGSTGQCAPIGQPVNSGETTYPPDACSTANARAVDGEANIAISIVDKAKAYSVAERGSRNIAVTRAANGGDIIWNTKPSLPTQTPNPHAGLTPDCPWPLPPLPQAQQPCGNATAKSSYGNGNLAVAAPNGDHTFTWAESSGGSYNQTLTIAEGANSQSRSRAIYNNYGIGRATATNGGHADTLAVIGYQNVALANATGSGAVANATAAGPYARATAAASSGGTASAMHNTTNIIGFFGTTPNAVACSEGSVAYAMIGTGQSCGSGF